MDNTPVHKVQKAVDLRAARQPLLSRATLASALGSVTELTNTTKGTARPLDFAGSCGPPRPTQAWGHSLLLAKLMGAGTAAVIRGFCLASIEL